ncbi:hypothetical protein CEXT_694251 [Caerostris extrusa]|uniref:Uncharacterized protein n=1 Tax=Caerostris extrusa TaxID=172846 RepID=A0AAV4UK99_CAEEX|nr:hypothetical protein CEXT_694251 [Caerostris extrusa]
MEKPKNLDKLVLQDTQLTELLEFWRKEIDEMHQNFNIYVQHWSTEKDQFFCMTKPDCMSHKIERIGITKLGLTNLLTDKLSLFQAHRQLPA